MDPRQERKDQVYRRRTWRVLGVAAVVGVLLLLGFEFWLRSLGATSGPRLAEASGLLAMVSHLIHLAIAALLLLLGRYLLDLARQSGDQNQWPPAGIQTLSKRPPRHGADARRIASRLRIAGLGMLFAAVTLVIWTALRIFG